MPTRQTTQALFQEIPVHKAHTYPQATAQPNYIHLDDKKHSRTRLYTLLSFGNLSVQARRHKVCEIAITTLLRVAVRFVQVSHISKTPWME